MSREEAARLFEEANDLWYFQGLTRRALALYRQASGADPADPVVLYQLARALRAFSRFDEARAALVRAGEHAGRLSPLGRELLAEELRRLSPPVPFRFTPPVDDENLDAERLARRELSSAEWLSLSNAAGERGMHGLAAYAIRNSGGGVLELIEDEREAERDAHASVNELELMRAEGSSNNPALPAPARGDDERPSSLVPTTKQTPAPATPSAPPAPRTDALAPSAGTPTTDDSSLVPRTGLTSLHPLAVDIRLDPAGGRGGGPALTVSLVNRGERPAAVNRRLLLNHPTSPPQYGELYLSVEGPQGYQNMTRYHVRAGAPRPEHFGLLAPGDSVSETYSLRDYESMHLPGTYKVWVTYRNTVPGSVHGLPVYVGSISSPAVSLERWRA
jgi:hypothetical protein